MTWPIDKSLLLFFAGSLGLLIGSFLNVVVHRWPTMLMRQWELELQSTPDSPPAPPQVNVPVRYDLSFPGSHCPHCLHALRWYENLPVLSFLIQWGKCRSCKAPISWQYPLVELFASCLFLGLAHQSGAGLTSLSWAVFLLALLVLAIVDYKTQWLPDQGTLTLLWLGLLVALLNGTGRVTIHDAVIGAMAGYLMPWCVAKVFWIITGREGMGYGDFKLLAAMGAWLGWMVLPGIFLMASVTGSVTGLYLRTGDRPMPFGPFLCLGALMAWLNPSFLLLP
jgi:leader peptidase (prepilin peptidase)/N-methyltransferase